MDTFTTRPKRILPNKRSSDVKLLTSYRALVQEDFREVFDAHRSKHTEMQW